MAFRFDDGDEPIVSDINVTPLVDVMLVLLIIFMVAAPMLQQGIAVDLPRAQAAPLPQDNKEPLIVSIRGDGLVYLGRSPIHATQLAERLLPLVRSRADQRVFVRADQAVAYGKVIEVLDVLRRGGIVNIGMVTESESKGP